MAGMAQGAGTGPRDRIAFAVILIVVGIGGLLTQMLEPTPDVGGWIVMLIGVGLMGAFAYAHQYGYLIPGSIMTGLGAGIVISETVALSNDEATGGVIVLGLGIGFLAIWVIGGIVHLAQHHWWPLIPGGILAVVGGALLIGGQAIQLLDYWGVVVIGVGLFVLWRAFGEGRART